ncbi:equilibrative nucleobase transporter 1-like isoform X2 [Narcine bancroftii]|uniref:equilibrative nucleobase transporter 1-like isoform X2 n=1 Tax=Narcine bancroftii TaxID=1343680 RepID=UPI0038310D20
MEILGERSLRYLLLFSGLLECLGFVGVIYGWPSLVFILKDKAFFADLCLAMHNSSNSGARNDTVNCDLQDERLALIFTITTFTIPLLTIINGVLLDYYGTMAARFLSISEEHLPLSTCLSPNK